MDITLHPLLSGDEKLRRVGIMPGYELNVHSVEAELRRREGRPRSRATGSWRSTARPS